MDKAERPLIIRLVKNEYYEFFAKKRKSTFPPNPSVFWDPEFGYVPKYKNVNMNRSEAGPVKKKTMEGNQNGNN